MTSRFDLRAIAHALGGEVCRDQVLAPGPGHSPKDRSLSVRIAWPAPDGFLVYSHAGDNFGTCRDYVRSKLGISRQERAEPVIPRLPREKVPLASDEARIARAAEIWLQAQDPHGTLVERYLAGRDLELPPGRGALRFHPRCPWREGEQTVFVPTMLAAMRSTATDRLTAIHRTRLAADSTKVDRRMLGIAAGAAIKLDPDEAVTTGLAIGEGVETCLAAYGLGLRPVWAVASAGALAAFPVLAGIECITFLAENDAASERAIAEAAARWHAAGREVVIVTPVQGSDLNDAVRAA